MTEHDGVAAYLYDPAKLRALVLYLYGREIADRCWDVDDIAQDTCVELLESRYTLNGRAAPATVVGHVVNRVLKRLRDAEKSKTRPISFK